MSVLVTGAAGDIGAAIAETLALAGRALVLADHPDAAGRLERTASRCRALAVGVSTTTFDVADSDAVDSALADIEGLDGVVNNAGYQGVFAPIDRYPLADAERVVAVNLLGTIAVTAASAAALIRSGGGAIVNVSSMAGVSGAPNMPAYSAAKAAVIGLTKATAKDLAPWGIRVNAISPAFIGPGRMWETQVAAQAAVGSQYFAADPELVGRQMIELVPLRRLGTASEVASVVAFLLSDGAGYLTGTNIEISGGSV